MNGFDSLGYAQKLREVGIPQEQAEAQAALLRDQVLAHVATKADLLSVEERLSTKIDRIEERLRAEMKLADQKMTVTLGSMIVAATIVLLAALALLAA